MKDKMSPASESRCGVKLIIFDLDGTIIDAYRAIEVSHNFTMRKLGLPKHKPLAIKRAVGWGPEALLVPFVPKRLLPKAMKIYNNHHKIELLRKSKLISKARDILVYLRKKDYILAVASNRPTRFSHILLRKLNIRKYFSLVVCSDKLKRGKPHPEIIFRIMNKLKVTKKESLYVGDMAIDVQAGKRAGIRTVAVLTGSSSEIEIKKHRPNYIFKNISYLKKIL